MAIAHESRDSRDYITVIHYSPAIPHPLELHPTQKVNVCQMTLHIVRNLEDKEKHNPPQTVKIKFSCPQTALIKSCCPQTTKIRSGHPWQAKVLNELRTKEA
jgi:hypothetical protein